MDPFFVLAVTITVLVLVIIVLCVALSLQIQGANDLRRQLRILNKTIALTPAMPVCANCLKPWWAHGSVTGICPGNEIPSTFYEARKFVIGRPEFKGCDCDRIFCPHLEAHAAEIAEWQKRSGQGIPRKEP